MKKGSINTLLEWMLWIAGILTTLVVASGMIDKSLTISLSFLSWMNDFLPFAGWVVLVAIVVGIIARFMK